MKLKKPDWVLIRNLGQVKYFNISYGVLLIVPIIVEFSNKINTTLNSRMIDLPETIRWIYLASLMYAVAIAVYQFACPKIIRNYEKWQDYLRDNLDILNRDYLEFKIDVVLANLNDHEEKLREEIEKLILDVEEYTGDLEMADRLDKLVESAYPRCNQRALEREFNDARIKSQWAIWFSGLFYLAGSLILVSLLIIRSINVFFQINV